MPPLDQDRFMALVAEAVPGSTWAFVDAIGMRQRVRALELLERYELLVPGTRLMTRYLALQPIYARHPMRRLLLGTAS